MRATDSNGLSATTDGAAIAAVDPAKAKAVGSVRTLDAFTQTWRDATKAEAAGHVESVDLPPKDQD